MQRGRHSLRVVAEDDDDLVASGIPGGIHCVLNEGLPREVDELLRPTES